jgi:antibiotic biosynthesis monooxygenase (ABM) superfamily enzyme
VTRAAGEDATTTAVLIARHQVRDYGTWREVYDSAENIRQQYGHLGAEILTDPGNKNHVVVIDRFPALEAAQAFAGSSELRVAMSPAGLTGAPRIEIAVEA